MFFVIYYFIANTKCKGKNSSEVPTWCYLGMQSEGIAYCDEDRDLCICKGVLVEDATKSSLDIILNKYYVVHRQKGWKCKCK